MGLYFSNSRALFDYILNYMRNQLLVTRDDKMHTRLLNTRKYPHAQLVTYLMAKF